MNNALQITALVAISCMSIEAASLTFTSKTMLTLNATSFNVSLYPGNASFQANIDTGDTTVKLIGDGTLLDWKFLGSTNLNNLNFNDNNVGYANGPENYINDPTSFQVNGTNIGAPANIYTPQSWGKVWTTNDPGSDFLLNPANVTSFTVLQSGSVSNPNGPVVGTVNISTLSSGQFFIFAGGYQANTDYIVTLSGPGQPNITASHNNVINANNNRVYAIQFDFDNAEGLYDTLTYTYRHNSANIRGRYMGVALDGIVAGGGDGPRFEITSIELLPDNMISLTWNSKPNAVYTVFYSTDATDFSSDAGDNFASQGDTTTHTFLNPTVSGDPPSTAPTVLFRVGENSP